MYVCRAQKQEGKCVREEEPSRMTVEPMCALPSSLLQVFNFLIAFPLHFFFWMILNLLNAVQIVLFLFCAFLSFH